jgi:hypothetical protein
MLSIISAYSENESLAPSGIAAIIASLDGVSSSGGDPSPAPPGVNVAAPAFNDFDVMMMMILLLMILSSF